MLAGMPHVISELRRIEIETATTTKKTTLSFFLSINQQIST
jgi:hypothetical protein